MNGVYLRRGATEIGAVLSAAILALGLGLNWNHDVINGLIALVAAGVAVWQAVNVFGTDQFTAVVLNLVAAGFALIALWLPIRPDLQSAAAALVVVVLGLFARNGVTNKYSRLGAPRALTD